MIGSWKCVIGQSLLEGLWMGLLVGGIASLALGRWYLGAVLFGTSSFVLGLAAKIRQLP